MRRIIGLVVAAGCVCASGVCAGASEKPLSVVTTLSTFADLVSAIGGNHVAVTSIASPKFNPHFIEPKPSDVLKVKRAGLFMHAGLDLELWVGPLLDAAGNRDVMPGGPRELDLSHGIALLEVPTRPLSRAAGDIHLYGNPHYWLDPENAKTMAQTIQEKLSELDPAHDETYRANLEAFLARLDEKIAVWRSQLAPYRDREVVGYHNEWPYLMHFAGLKMEQFLEPKPGIPPTPKQLEFIEGYITQRRIRTIVQPTFYPAQAAGALTQRTGAQALILCQSVREAPECSDYVAMIDHDIQQLLSALK